LRLPTSLTADDLHLLATRGITVAEAERQLALLRSPPRPRELDRPCRYQDGILVLGEQEAGRLAERYRRERARGRCAKLVPASGAATRMFHDLLAALDEDPFPDAVELDRRARQGDSTAQAVERLCRELPRFAFHDELARSLGSHGGRPEELCHTGRQRTLLRHLLTGEGLGLADLPKGLIPFHRYGDEVATAVAEHLAEGAAYLSDRDGRCRLHFTVPPEHRQLFAAEVAAVVKRLGARAAVSFEVDDSVQDPATDTLAVSPEGEPFRDDAGALLLRPGGHGALLGNLEALGGDLVFIKNIDNVLPRPAHAALARWQETLGGLLVLLEERCHELLRRLEAGEPVIAEALHFLGTELGDPEAARFELLEDAARRHGLREHLNRPLRVCGVVRNEGEPGGGPFWVRRADGTLSRQIVERAELSEERGQAEIFASATHFNPVQMVCALRDFRGEPFDLQRHADPRAVVIAAKYHQGRELRALERPGLWNGGMAHWHTVFVEIPGELFAPVKTVFDLLRPAHQPG
jgi:hypothetical protein